MSGSRGMRGTTPAIARRCSVLGLIPSNSAASSSRRAMRSESGTGCPLSDMAAAAGHGADPCREAMVRALPQAVGWVARADFVSTDTRRHGPLSRTQPRAGVVEGPSDDDLVAYGLGPDLGQPRIGLGSIFRPDTSQSGERHRVATGLGEEVTTKAEVMGPARARGSRPIASEREHARRAQLASIWRLTWILRSRPPPDLRVLGGVFRDVARDCRLRAPRRPSRPGVISLVSIWLPQRITSSRPPDPSTVTATARRGTGDGLR